MKKGLLAFLVIMLIGCGNQKNLQKNQSEQEYHAISNDAPLEVEEVSALFNGEEVSEQNIDEVIVTIQNKLPKVNDIVFKKECDEDPNSFCNLEKDYIENYTIQPSVSSHEIEHINLDDDLSFNEEKETRQMVKAQGKKKNQKKKDNKKKNKNEKKSKKQKNKEKREKEQRRKEREKKLIEKKLQEEFNSTHDFSLLQKINPVFWVKNADDPEAPDWFLPGKKFRNLRWHLRNPLHNFTFYVIGVGDKIYDPKFERKGKHPNAVFAPEHGWNYAYIKYKGRTLPFISYYDENIKFYIGWREKGNLGFKITKGQEELAPSKDSNKNKKKDKKKKKKKKKNKKKK